MLPHGYRHIIWDWNGTLLDDVDFIIAVMNELLRRRGLPLLDRPRYHRVFDFPVRDYYGRLGLDVATFDGLSVEFITGYDHGRWECRLHLAADALLRAVQEAGLTQSILSAYRQETLAEMVSHFGLSQRFIRLTGLDNIQAHGKLELGRKWLGELGLPPSAVVLIGDTLHDCDVATALGIDCLLVSHGHHPAERLHGSGRPVLPDLRAVADRLGLSVPAEVPPPVEAAG